jgi:hypothetical protein
VVVLGSGLFRPVAGSPQFFESMRCLCGFGALLLNAGWCGVVRYGGDC